MSRYIRGSVNNVNLDSFSKHIRSCNIAVAIASFGATYDKLRRNGPKIVRIHGQMYHKTLNIYSVEDFITPKYTQHYVYDSSEAAAIKMQSKGYERCNEELMLILNTIMITNSPFA